MAAPAQGESYVMCPMLYLVHKEGDVPPFFYGYKRTDGGPQRHPGKQEHVDCKLFDARPQLAEMTLDRNGACLVPHGTALSTADFYSDPDKITGMYYREMEELVKEKTGASRVIVFDHNVRNSDVLNEPANAMGRQHRQVPGGSIVDPPAVGALSAVHNDYTPWSAPQRIRDLAKPSGQGGSYTLPGQPPLIREDEVDTLLGNRYIFVNVWRNISEIPISKHPLAICDGSTIKEEHFVPRVAYLKDRTGETFGMKHDPNHRWLYFAEMRKDEAILLKCMDSKEGVTRWTGHTGAELPGTSESAPPRESIEARCIAFFAANDKEKTNLPSFAPTAKL